MCLNRVSVSKRNQISHVCLYHHFGQSLYVCFTLFLNWPIYVQQCSCPFLMLSNTIHQLMLPLLLVCSGRSLRFSSLFLPVCFVSSYSLMKRNETCTAIFPWCFSPLVLNPTNHLCFSACFVTSQAHWSRMVLSTHLRSALSMKTCIIRQWALWPANTSTSKPFASLITFFFPDWFSHLIGSLITLLAIHLFSFHSSER